jgi:TRAP-type C4-dicarboxylate transport system substrate-binding protein
MSPEVLVMSKRAWESLSEEDKAIFRDAARESNRFMREQWSALEDQSRQQAQAAGNVIIADVPRQPFQEAMTSIYARVTSDPAMKAIVDRIRGLQ